MIKVNGIQLHYEVYGSGEAILFLHGLGSAGRDWEFQVSFFSRRYTVITCDTRGHGASEKPPGPYSVSLFAQDIAALVDALGVAPVNVVGVSMGGMILFQLMLDFPQKVKSAVIVNSAPEIVLRTPGNYIEYLQRLWIVRLLGMRRMGVALGEKMFPKPEQAELREEIAKRWAENDPRAYQETIRALVGWQVTGRLGEIRCPVLVVSADQDYIPVEAKAAYTRQIPNAKLMVIDDSRHGTPVDQPDKFNQVVLEFLQSV